jgi:hypothetical protein
MKLKNATPRIMPLNVPSGSLHVRPGEVIEATAELLESRDVQKSIEYGWLKEVTEPVQHAPQPEKKKFGKSFDKDEKKGGGE